VLRLKNVVTRDQAIVLACLAIITVLAWIYLVGMASDMAEMADMVGMPDMENMAGMALVTPFAAWGLADVVAAALMWIVMMAGMMLPTAAPTMALYVRAERSRGAAALVNSAAFVSGYLIVWTGFSFVAVGTQWLLLRLGLFAPEMMVTSGLIGGALFVAAGLYEFSPLKYRCLALCQSPLGFIMGHWRPGLAGALRLGLAHGTYCLGCCWVLMLLLFAVGVMNLLWVAALAALVLLQKVVPGERRVAQATGALMILVGFALVARAFA